MLKKIIRTLFFLGLLVTAIIATQTQAASPGIKVLNVKGTINPALVGYIERGIEQAEEENAAVCIIQLDTPGGLDTAMRDIIQNIVNAKVPVVVYVSPSGARAASAGVFVTMAAHVAAMAPNTAIGAAHPVAIGSEGEQAMSEAMQEKVVNDAAAYIRSIASAHGRNMEWAEKAVRESVSATEEEALELNVIDIVAADMDDLITQLDGRQVTMLDGNVVTIHTEGATMEHIPMSIIEDFLYALSDPNIAYLLLSLAMLGIMVEITNPGLIFPGIVGAISLLFAFYSLGVLPVNWAGVLLIVLAFGLFVAEVFTTTFGLLTAGGVTALVIGSLILFKGGPLFQVNLGLIAGITIFFASLLAFVVHRVIRAHRHQASTGREELIGKTAVVTAALEPEGTIFFKGERWIAVAEKGRVKLGETVIVTRVDGLKLYVTKKQQTG